jgi:hypothetical protein
VYSYTPDVDTDVAISTCGSGFDTKLLVSTNLLDPTTYMCNDDDRTCVTNTACSRLDVSLNVRQGLWMHDRVLLSAAPTAHVLDAVPSYAISRWAQPDCATCTTRLRMKFSAWALLNYYQMSWQPCCVVDSLPRAMPACKVCRLSNFCMARLLLHAGCHDILHRGGWLQRGVRGVQAVS